MGKQLPQLHNLSPSEAQRVIGDLEFELLGGKLFYAIEPTELFNYCFPIDPRLPELPDIDTIADEQAALYELFYVRKHKPILLPEYSKELQGILSYADRELTKVYNKAEMIETFIRAGGLANIENKDQDALQEIILEHFNVLLAVAMGVYKFGSERFKDIFVNRLVKSKVESGASDEDVVLESIFEKYKQTELVDLILSQIKTPRHLTDPADIERYRRALKVDARAVDRIIYLNSRLEKAYQDHELRNRHIILYLSNPKRHFLTLPEVKHALRIGGQRFNFWRTRNHLFAYVVHKSKNTDRLEGIRESIENLKNVKQVLEEVQKMEAQFSDLQCDTCLLLEHSPSDCRLEGFCRNVHALQSKIEEGRQEIENLGLINTINDYKRIVDVSTQEPLDHRYEKYVEIFTAAFNSGIKDVAIEKMRQRQQLILIKSEATNLFKAAYLRTKRGEDRYALRRREDAVTGVDQILPTKPKLQSQRFRNIFASILSYYKDPTQVELLETAHKGFLELDLGTMRREPEQELIRCYLYLAFTRGKDEQKAFEYAKALLQNQILIAVNPEISLEYRYVLCWAARRLGRFGEADQCAREGIMYSDGKDARFYHGLSLNTYSWLTADKRSKGQLTCPYGIGDAISNTEKAIQLYENKAEINKDVIAANYNNLAYFRAWEVTENQHSLEAGRELLHQAREALETLKALTITTSKEAAWSPDHPEFYHTEAYLEYQEYLLDFAGGASSEFLINKLEHAKREIDTAVDLYERGPLYRELAKSIGKSLNDLRAGRLSS